MLILSWVYSSTLSAHIYIHVLTLKAPLNILSVSH